MWTQVLVVEDTEMPRGHQWAVVTIGNDVLILVPQSAAEGIDQQALNAALAEAG